MSNKVYDALKFVAQIVLPAIGTLYFALAGIWGFPYGEQVVGTIAAIDAFLGAILGISSVQYYKSGKDTDGVLNIDQENEVITYNFGEVSVDDLLGKKVAKVKITSDTDPDYVGRHE